VPGGQTWTITEVDAQAVYFNGSGPADNFNVFFYADSGGLPGAAVYSATAQSYVNNAGVFQVTLTVPAVLGPGTYWVEVQAHMSFTPNGEWGWTNRTVQANNKASWQNPGGGFGPPASCPAPGCPNPCPTCQTWGVRECCTGTGLPQQSDQMFRLIGTLGGGTPTPTPTCPTAQNYVITQIGGSIVPGTTDIGNHGDDTVVTIALPFPFTLYNQSFTSINLSSNGNAQFTTTDTTFSNQCLPWAAHNYTIFPYWDDLYLVNSPSGIFTSISGTAPNRIFNIEWRGQYFPGSGTANFELRLYENSTRFDIIYGTLTNGNTSATAGVQKITDFTQYFCNGTGGAATGGQSYTLAPCATPTPTPTPTATATPTAGTPSPTPTCTPAAFHVLIV